jgi:hypothetical protein
MPNVWAPRGEGQDRSAAQLRRYEHALFELASRTPGPVRREAEVVPLAHSADETLEPLNPAARSGAARGAVPHPLEDLGREFPVTVLAYQSDVAFAAMKVGEGENP